MKRWITALAAAALVLGVLQVGPVLAVEKKGEEGPPDDPELIGEEVTEQSEIEKTLFTEYQKRRNKHFILETSYDMEAAKDYIAFSEIQYREFLKWAGKPADYELWNTRAHVVIVANKAEWECLIRYRNQHLTPQELELRKNIGGTWGAQPPHFFQYSREGSTPENDKHHMFHMLNHLFLHGLAKSGQDGCLWWLWESFSMYKDIEIFGSKGSGCINFETAAKTPEDRAWNDIDDWVTLLKRDVRTKQDEDFVLFWHKDVMSIQNKSYVKSWGIIRYLTRDDKAKEKFVQFIEMLKTKNEQRRALETIYGLDPDGLDKEWRTWIQRQPNRWRKSSGRDRNRNLR